MKAWLFTTVFGTYMFYGISGYNDYDYVNVNERDEVMSAFSPMIFMISVLIGIIFFVIFKISIKEEIRLGQQLGFLLFFIAFSFGSNWGLAHNFNRMRSKKSIMITGIIMDKYLKRNRGARHAQYYLVIGDSNKTESYLLEVTKDIYHHLHNKADTFSKQFQIGLLGITYRNEK